MPDETTQPNPEPTPTPTENQNSPSTGSMNSPQVSLDEPFVVPPQDFQPTEPVPIQTEVSGPTETPPIPESTPTTLETKPEIINDPANPNITMPQVSKTVFDMKSLFSKLKEKLSFRTEKRLSKIVDLARKKGEIRNDDVEKLLHVSDRTASRYLTKLAKQGRLRNIGNPKWPKYSVN